MTISQSGPVTRHHVSQRFSEAAVHNGVVYLAGQVPESHPHGDMRTQTAEVLERVERLLVECGSSKAHILSCQIFIKNPSDITVMNEVWDAWVVPGHTPPRCTVVAPMVREHWLIEVVVMGAQIRAA
ncbi:RidA family protein [Comamonas sp. NoAH]|uniref:RidA family protein n=1 Tax=Comamonas halotolerans TaxID=3041496 RepID=UPI0024E0FD87|nr:RidA family protein [Comamonas sp. NoAH]